MGAPPRFFGVGMEIRTADSRDEQRISREQIPIVQQVAGALERMARRADRSQAPRSERDHVFVVNGCVCVVNAILPRQEQRSARLFGQYSCAQQMIGMDMGIEDEMNAPAAFLSESEVDFRRQ